MPLLLNERSFIDPFPLSIYIFLSNSLNHLRMSDIDYSFVPASQPLELPKPEDDFSVMQTKLADVVAVLKQNQSLAVHTHMVARLQDAETLAKSRMTEMELKFYNLWKSGQPLPLVNWQTATNHVEPEYFDAIGIKDDSESNDDLSFLSCDDGDNGHGGSYDDQSAEHTHQAPNVADTETLNYSTLEQEDQDGRHGSPFSSAYEPLMTIRKSKKCK
jgi:hypothetical protein